MLTPAMVHLGSAQEVLLQRHHVFHAAYADHPEHFVKGPPLNKPLTQINNSREEVSGISTLTANITSDTRFKPIEDHLELWYRNECLERLPRLFGQGKESIDFRHVTDSLICKPGAFVNYKYVNHIYPNRFRMA